MREWKAGSSRSQLVDSVQHRDSFPEWQPIELDFSLWVKDDLPHTAL